MEAAYIALGSNLKQPQTQIENCLENLAKIDNITILQTSSLYLTAALFNTHQPDFINAVIKVSTSLPPIELLQKLLNLEVQQGRLRDGTKWGPRVIDLDLLMYGAMVVDTPFLRLPHPHIRDRAFVLVPLLEIEPDICLPTGEALESYKQDLLKSQAIKKLTERQHEHS